MRYIVLILLCILSSICSSSEYYSPTSIEQVHHFCNYILRRLDQQKSHLKIAGNNKISWQSKIFLGKSAQDKKNRRLFMLIMSALKKKEDDWSISTIKTPKDKWGLRLYQDSKNSFKRKKIKNRMKILFECIKGPWYSACVSKCAKLGLINKSLTHVLYEKEQQPPNRIGNPTENSLVTALAAYFNIAYQDITCMPQFIEGNNGTTLIAQGPHNKTLIYLLIDQEKLEEIQQIFDFSLSKKHISENMISYLFCR